MNGKSSVLRGSEELSFHATLVPAITFNWTRHNNSAPIVHFCNISRDSYVRFFYGRVDVPHTPCKRTRMPIFCWFRFRILLRN